MKNVIKKIAEYLGIIIGFFGILLSMLFMLQRNNERKKRIDAERENVKTKAKDEHEKIKSKGNIAIANDTADMLDED